jgi:1,4-dihydroxy-2-naphthoate octaprenyltransferase
MTTAHTDRLLSAKDITSVLTHFRTWLRNSRMIALPQSLLPAITAAILALDAPTFSPYLAIIAVVGVVFGHLSSNLFDDYFDHRKNRSDYRNVLFHKGMRARIGKCPYLLSGENTIGQLLAACIVFGVIAIIAGLVILLYRGNVILIWAAIAAILGVSYSGYPFRFSYHGLGEIVIGLMFGPLAMTGVYYAACGTLASNVIWLSIPIGLLVFNIVYSHAIMDFIPDKEINKRTLAVVLNSNIGMLSVSAISCFVPFVLLALGVVFGYLNAWYLSAFLTLPMAINLFYLMVQYIKHPDKTFSPRFWMGPMSRDWKEKKEYGVDWFAIRWLLARNLVSFFSIIISVVTILV